MKKLKLEEIRNELKNLQKNKLCVDSNKHINADYLNPILRMLGCDLYLVKNSILPGSNDGTNLFMALLYSNLLLAERIALIEKSIDLHQENKSQGAFDLDFIFIDGIKMKGCIAGKIMAIFDPKDIKIILSMSEKNEIFSATYKNRKFIGRFNKTSASLESNFLGKYLKIGFYPNV